MQRWLWLVLCAAAAGACSQDIPDVPQVVAPQTPVETDKDSDGVWDSDVPTDLGDSVTAVGVDTGTAGDGGTAVGSDTADSETVLPPWDPPVIDTAALPDGMPVVNILIDDVARAQLESNPFDGPDVPGSFVGETGHTYTVDINYRGAYQLQNLIEYTNLRNWKVKFPKTDKYHDRREWNFNYEPHLRQKLALDLMWFAGVPVPNRVFHVMLQVNGQNQGMYLAYEDPDNKDWLWEVFGFDDGDLFKAATDKPGMSDAEKCFADFTILGPSDSDYMCHYVKKTNHKVAPNDYSSLRIFITELNQTPEDQLESWFESHFHVDAFLSYLVVSNFIANWDSYPQRPKNFWVYQDLRAEKMAFIPWDLDSTFHSTKDVFNQMGTDCSVLFDLETNDYQPYHASEGTERPLARRLIALPKYRQAYLDRYRELLGTILSEQFLYDRMDALTAVVRPHLSADDRAELDDNNTWMKAFISARIAHVTSELAGLP